MEIESIGFSFKSCLNGVLLISVKYYANGVYLVGARFGKRIIFEGLVGI
jgi:hypothetical protein